MPATENLHICGLMHRSKQYQLFDHLVGASRHGSGTVTPSASAVLRFRNSSTFVLCWTDSSLEDARRAGWIAVQGNRYLPAAPLRSAVGGGLWGEASVSSKLDETSRTIKEETRRMSYNMQAEGLNGVSEPTNIGANDWSAIGSAPVLKVDAFQRFHSHNLTALECDGSGTGAGVIGRGEAGPGVIGAARGDAEGVRGESETGIGVLGKNGGGGPAVKGLGGDASNPSSVNPNASPVNAGLGAIAVGGDSAAGVSIVINNHAVVFPALPAAHGLVAVAGGASLHEALTLSNGIGVVGMGSPN